MGKKSNLKKIKRESVKEEKPEKTNDERKEKSEKRQTQENEQAMRYVVLETDGNRIHVTENTTSGNLELISMLQMLLNKLTSPK